MHAQTFEREGRLLGTPGVSVPTLETGLVAVCLGEGNRRLFRELGATTVIEGGQTMNPSAAEIVEAIEATPAGEVIVLPNNPNVVATAEQAVALASRPARGRARALDPGRASPRSSASCRRTRRSRTRPRCSTRSRRPSPAR